VKCHIMADYLQTILFIGMYVTAVGIISPVELAREVSHVRIQVSHGKILTSKCSRVSHGKILTSICSH